ncbi:MAG: MoaD/ThiS family protein [Propionibacteriaceae bacterium]|jgi:molybdopterin converting factor small subunit|nr:MoaD/ThiS family protein [Propionibacteriaceae bacterium]
MATVFIPTALRAYTERQARVTVAGATVAEALANLTEAHPGLTPHVHEPDGSLRGFVNIFVGDTNVKQLQGGATPLTDDSEVLIVPAIAGGRAR